MKLPKAPWLEIPDRINDGIRMRPDSPPIRSHQHQNRKSTAAKILLVPQVLIGRYHCLEAFRFRRFKQIAVLFVTPATLIGGRDFMANQCSA